MKMKQLLFLILFMFTLSVLLWQTESGAQNTDVSHVLKEGLVLRLPGSGRTLFRVDPIEQALVLGEWSPPGAGDRVKIGEEVAIWEPIQADSNGWFSGRRLRGAYVYFFVQSSKREVKLLDQMGNDMVYVNGVPRIGNRYGYKDKWESWEPPFNYSILPVSLHKGRNEFLFFCSRGRLKASLQKPGSPVLFNVRDVTLPDLIVGEKTDAMGAVVVVNVGNQPLENLSITARFKTEKETLTKLPVIQPLTIRKIAFKLRGEAPKNSGTADVKLQLWQNKKPLASARLQVRIVEQMATHKCTFISKIDGSVQYYAVNPAQDKNGKEEKALILSVHGADVEALNQANSYYGKTWAHIVSPTNRRPYGFDWEDWGRLDALEVLGIVRDKLDIDPDRIYLTGHSMGGHGTWYLGLTYPDLFGAIGPSAGWISWWSYRVREKEPERSPMQKMLQRATLPCNTIALAKNSRQYGVYILHGEKDDNVPVGQAKMMVAELKKFHKDFIFHEEPGQKHWWDISDEPGADCVDWPPMFDFFARHARPGKERIRVIDFLTANPGISARNNWITIFSQNKQLRLSSIHIQVDPGKRRFIGQTKNIACFAIDLSVLSPGGNFSVEMDGEKISNIPRPADANLVWFKRNDESWQLSPKPSPDLKGPHRYGLFKDAFRNRMIFVYGTKGTREENRWAYQKSRFDAEQFWYQGNGSVDIIPDVAFSADVGPDRNTILYGNEETNAAWKILLDNSPVQVYPKRIELGERNIEGENIACLFIRPRPGSKTASVGVVSGTSITGMRTTNRLPYLSPGYAFPDVIVLTPQILSEKEKGVLAAGFFGPDWRVKTGEFVWSQE